MRTYLAFGSNIGDRQHAIQEAISALTEIVGPCLAVSSLHDTEPVGMTSPHRFLNACACFETSLSPAQLLFVTQEIERAMGRTDKSTTDAEGHAVHFDRIIDIDILTLGDIVLNDEEVLPGQRLTLPHPRMHERPFVMQPLSEILDI